MQEENPRLKGKVQRHLCVFLKWAWIKLAIELCVLIMCYISDFCLAQAIHMIACYFIFIAGCGSFFSSPVVDAFYVSRVDVGWLSFGRRLSSAVASLCLFFFFLLFFLTSSEICCLPVFYMFIRWTSCWMSVVSILSSWPNGVIHTLSHVQGLVPFLKELFSTKGCISGVLAVVCFCLQTDLFFWVSLCW